jgi:hypothetical protein
MHTPRAGNPSSVDGVGGCLATGSIATSVKQLLIIGEECRSVRPGLSFTAEF